MPGLTEVRDAACRLLQGLSDVERVEAFAGELDMKSVSSRNVQHTARASLFVAVAEAENAAPETSLDFDMAAVFVAFAVSRHASRPTHAEAAALALVQEAARLLHGATFGLNGLSPARVLSIAPVSDAELARNGIWVWSVVWGQRVILNLPSAEAMS